MIARLALLLVAALAPGAPAPGTSRPIRPPGRVLTVTYYMTFARCASCLRIEAFTRDAVAREFPREVQNGRVRFAMVNIEEKGNEHFADDYRLLTKSVIVAERVKGKEVRWKNLPRVWELQHAGFDPFREYLRDEVRAWLKES